MIVAVPASTPLTTPLEEPTAATDVAPLLHVPPPPSLKVIDDPAHTADKPEISDGTGLTVTVVFTVQPAPAVYVIVAVPATNPLTTPEPNPTDATVVLPLVHVPPPASLSVVERPAQTEVIPVMAVGSGFTVTVVVMIQPVGSV